MKVLLSSASFLPSYGGPAYSVRSLADRLARNGLDVAIWAPDGSASHTALRPDPVGEVACGLHGPLDQVLSTFGMPDIFHDSGLWWRHNRAINAAAGRFRRPVVVSVRGMLEPAALEHRAWKKWIAWRLYQRRDLQTAAALHVTSDLEAGNVRALDLGPEIICIPNGIAVPDRCPPYAPARKEKRVAFLGRIHPIKGLPMLLEAWARIRPHDWTLEIAGPDEGGHRKALEAQAEKLALGGAVFFADPVGEAEKSAFFQRASVFVLPSYSENFGVAAGEALAAGVPVVATRATPWAALEAERCGWHVETSADGLERGLRCAFATPPEELVAMGERGYKYVAETFSWIRVGHEMTALYRRLLEQNLDE